MYISIAFDDGYLSVYKRAFPILSKHDFTATMFPVANWIGRKGFLSKAQLKELVEAGWSLGSHTLTHRDLTSLSYEEITKEMLLSKRKLELLFDTNIGWLSYPYYNNYKVVKLAKKIYDACFTNSIYPPMMQ